MTTSNSVLAGPRQLQTRFLYPFFFRRNYVKQACAALQEFTIGKDNKSLHVWECGEPHVLYKEDLLPHVVQFLFPGIQGAGCGYLKFSPAIGNMWFNKLEMVVSQRKLPVRLLPERIELFLSSYGVGVLSVALGLDQEPVSFDEALEFNYRLSQWREQTTAKLRIPHPSSNLQKWQQLPEQVKAQIPEPPVKQAPLQEQIGRAGGEFTLYGLVHYLLRPLDSLNFRAVQDELLTYTIARFDEKVDFGNTEVCADLAPFLAALAQVEEPEHAGGGAVTNAILNRRHWAGVGLLGAAHIVADQSPADHPFNSARVPRVLLKYYIPYLLALLQRLTLHSIIDEAGPLVMARDDTTGSALVDLRKHLLQFAVMGHFTEVSNREALHRYYRMCQQGQDVPNALTGARQAIADLEARNTAESQTEIALETAQGVTATRNLQQDMAENVQATRKLQEQMTEHLSIVARVQSIVEWLEIFVVAVAVAELWHMFASENKPLWDRLPNWANKLFDQREWFVSWSVAFVAVLAGFVAFWFIWRLRHQKHAPRESDKT